MEFKSDKFASQVNLQAILGFYAMSLFSMCYYHPSKHLGTIFYEKIAIRIIMHEVGSIEATLINNIHKINVFSSIRRHKKKKTFIIFWKNLHSITNVWPDLKVEAK